MRRARACVRARRALNVLIACEESQAECIAFRRLGHNAFSCDVQVCRKKGYPQWHIHGDATPYLHGETRFKTQDGMLHVIGKWDLIIAHPPCTYLCKVSSIWICRHTVDGDIINEERLAKMQDAAKFFYTCLNADAPYVAVENPIPMKRAGLPQPSFYVHPSWFGVKYTKKTLYWTKNLPPIFATVLHPNPKCFVNASRGKYRSRTFPQVAEALATQWSEFILQDTNTNRPADYSLAR